MERRSVVYIDGFNLYYGAIRGTPFKWLNIERYIELIRPHDDIQAIRYFTALIDGVHRPNQEAYLAALATLPKVSIYLGRYMHKEITCRVAGCSFRSTRVFKKPEEKQTDVNIALQMLDDAYQGIADRIILISGDSDLVPAINIVKRRFPSTEVVVYVPSSHPSRGAAVELRTAADRSRSLPLVELKHAQFPKVVQGSGNSMIKKPVTW